MSDSLNSGSLNSASYVYSESLKPLNDNFPSAKYHCQEAKASYLLTFSYPIEKSKEYKGSRFVIEKTCDRIGFDFLRV